MPPSLFTLPFPIPSPFPAHLASLIEPLLASFSLILTSFVAGIILYISFVLVSTRWSRARPVAYNVNGWGELLKESSPPLFPTTRTSHALPGIPGPGWLRATSSSCETQTVSSLENRHALPPCDSAAHFDGLPRGLDAGITRSKGCGEEILALANSLVAQRRDIAALQDRVSGLRGADLAAEKWVGELEERVGKMEESVARVWEGLWTRMDELEEWCEVVGGQGAVGVAGMNGGLVKCWMAPDVGELARGGHGKQIWACREGEAGSGEEEEGGDKRVTGGAVVRDEWRVGEQRLEGEQEMQRRKEEESRRRHREWLEQFDRVDHFSAHAWELPDDDHYVWPYYAPAVSEATQGNEGAGEEGPVPKSAYAEGMAFADQVPLPEPSSRYSSSLPAPGSTNSWSAQTQPSQAASGLAPREPQYVNHIGHITNAWTGTGNVHYAPQERTISVQAGTITDEVLTQVAEDFNAEVEPRQQHSFNSSTAKNLSPGNTGTQGSEARQTQRANTLQPEQWTACTVSTPHRHQNTNPQSLPCTYNANTSNSNSTPPPPYLQNRTTHSGPTSTWSYQGDVFIPPMIEELPFILCSSPTETPHNTTTPTGTQTRRGAISGPSGTSRERQTPSRPDNSNGEPEPALRMLPFSPRTTQHSTPHTDPEPGDLFFRAKRQNENLYGLEPDELRGEMLEFPGYEWDARGRYVPRMRGGAGKPAARAKGEEKAEGNESTKESSGSGGTSGDERCSSPEEAARGPRAGKRHGNTDQRGMCLPGRSCTETGVGPTNGPCDGRGMDGPNCTVYSLRESEKLADTVTVRCPCEGRGRDDPRCTCISGCECTPRATRSAADTMTHSPSPPQRPPPPVPQCTPASTPAPRVPDYDAEGDAPSRELRTDITSEQITQIEGEMGLALPAPKEPQSRGTTLQVPVETRLDDYERRLYHNRARMRAADSAEMRRGDIQRDLEALRAEVSAEARIRQLENPEGIGQRRGGSGGTTRLEQSPRRRGGRRRSSTLVSMMRPVEEDEEEAEEGLEEPGKVHPLNIVGIASAIDKSVWETGDREAARRYSFPSHEVDVARSEDGVNGTTAESTGNYESTVEGSNPAQPSLSSTNIPAIRITRPPDTLPHNDDAQEPGRTRHHQRRQSVHLMDEITRHETHSFIHESRGRGQDFSQYAPQFCREGPLESVSPSVESHPSPRQRATTAPLSNLNRRGVHGGFITGDRGPTGLGFRTAALRAIGDRRPDGTWGSRYQAQCGSHPSPQPQDRSVRPSSTSPVLRVTHINGTRVDGQRENGEGDRPAEHERDRDENLRDGAYNYPGWYQQ